MSSWQQWDDEEFLSFLKEFYENILYIAQEICSHSTAEYTLAIFDKIAPPTFYLQEEFEKWKRKKVKPKSPEMKAVAESIGREDFSYAKPRFYTPKGVENIRWQASSWVRKGDSDRVAREGEDAWCYSNDASARDLSEIIGREGTAPILIGESYYLCEFTGDGKFISRKRYEQPVGGA